MYRRYPDIPSFPAVYQFLGYKSRISEKERAERSAGRGFRRKKSFAFAFMIAQYDCYINKNLLSSQTDALHPLDSLPAGIKRNYTTSTNTPRPANPTAPSYRFPPPRFIPPAKPRAGSRPPSRTVDKKSWYFHNPPGRQSVSQEALCPKAAPLPAGSESPVRTPGSFSPYIF